MTGRYCADAIVTCGRCTLVSTLEVIPVGGRLEGKVALVTGAAMGQGKSHCQRLAEEGADIIALDLCENLESVEYPLGSPADLDHTASLVEATGQRIFSAKADVRERDQLRDAIGKGVAELGKGLRIV